LEERILSFSLPEERCRFDVYVATTRSAFDGYYSFEKIPVGSYIVRIKNEAQDAEEFISRSVVIPPEGGYCDYIDLIYQEALEIKEMEYE